MALLQSTIRENQIHLQIQMLLKITFLRVMRFCSVIPFHTPWAAQCRAVLVLSWSVLSWPLAEGSGELWSNKVALFSFRHSSSCPAFLTEL